MIMQGKLNIASMKTGKNLKIFLFAFIFLNILAVMPAYPQSDSLLNYIEIAAHNNPSVQQKFKEYQAALEKIPQAGSLSDPQLNLGVFLQPMELLMGRQVAELSLMQMFPWFGVLRNAKDEMSLMANAKFELFRDTRFQVFYEVQRTWFDLYKIRKNISISEKNIEILKSIERLALIRYKAGPSGNPGTQSPSAPPSDPSQNMSPGSASGMQNMGQNAGTTSSNVSSSDMPSGSMRSSPGGSGLADLYRIRIEAGDLENNIFLLKSREVSILALFNSYLNRAPDSKVFTGEFLASDSLALPLLSYPDSILANNPMLSMLEFEKQSLEARKKMVTGMGYPMFGLGLNYAFINRSEMSSSPMNGNDMIMPMLSLTLPIYRKKYTAMKNEAELLADASSHNYEATANSIQNEYYQAIQLYQDAQRRVKLYENQYKLASATLDLMLKSFSTATSGLTDVLRVRQQTLDYELKQIEAVADLNTAVAWLNRLMAFSQLN
jgi:outer membrane protein TolC